MTAGEGGLRYGKARPFACLTVAEDTPKRSHPCSSSLLLIAKLNQGRVLPLKSLKAAVSEGTKGVLREIHPQKSTDQVNVCFEKDREQPRSCRSVEGLRRHFGRYKEERRSVATQRTACYCQELGAAQSEIRDQWQLRYLKTHRARPLGRRWP